MTDELKPVRCGCGGEAFIHILGNEIAKGYYIACDECGMKTRVFGYEAEAVEAWNRAMGNNIQSAEPERKTGRWQRRKGSDCWECSECHAVLVNIDIVRHNFYYCYHCGADMTNEDGYMRLEGTEHE